LKTTKDIFVVPVAMINLATHKYSDY